MTVKLESGPEDRVKIRSEDGFSLIVREGVRIGIVVQLSRIGIVVQLSRIGVVAQL